MLKRLLGLSVFVFAFLLLITSMIVSSESEEVIILPRGNVQWVAALPPATNPDTAEQAVQPEAESIYEDGSFHHIPVRMPLIYPEADANGTTLGCSSYYRAAYTAFRLSESGG